MCLLTCREMDLHSHRRPTMAGELAIGEDVLKRVHYTDLRVAMLHESPDCRSCGEALWAAASLLAAFDRPEADTPRLPGVQAGLSGRQHMANAPPRGRWALPKLLR